MQRDLNVLKFKDLFLGKFYDLKKLWLKNYSKYEANEINNLLCTKVNFIIKIQAKFKTFSILLSEKHFKH